MNIRISEAQFGDGITGYCEFINVCVGWLAMLEEQALEKGLPCARDEGWTGALP